MNQDALPGTTCTSATDCPLHGSACTMATHDPPAEEDNGRKRTLPEVILACQEQNIPAYVVGRWVWASFEDKPSAEIRTALKTIGFRWIKNREAWAHNCGYYTKQAKGYDPRDKYGTIPVDQYHLEGTE